MKMPSQPQFHPNYDLPLQGSQLTAQEELGQGMRGRRLTDNLSPCSVLEALASPDLLNVLKFVVI